VCTVAINTAVTVLLEKGLELYWWSQAVKHAQTPTELHDNWSSGKIIGAIILLFTKFKVSRLSAAAIFAAAVRVNGPLFQQAVNTTNINQSHNVRASVQIFERLPIYGSGITTGRNRQLTDITAGFAEVVAGYKDRSP